MKTTRSNLRFLRNILTGIGCILLAREVQAQTPNLMNYQAVVRDASGEVVANQAVAFRIAILQTDPSGAEVYSEEHTLNTNDFGLVAMQIGAGTNQVGSLTGIDWSADAYFVSVSIDLAGGTNFTLLGTSQLVAVPYALHARSVELDQVDDADADPANEIQTLSISGDTVALTQGGSVVLPPDQVEDADADPTNELQTLSTSNDTLYLSNGGAIDLSVYSDAVAIALLAAEADLDSAYLHSLIAANQALIALLQTELDQDSAALASALNDHLTADQDTSASNELQSISLSGNTLALTNGGSVDLSGYVDTDDQTLSTTASGTTRSISISDGNTISIDVADSDNSTTNEIQALTLSSNSLSLSNGGGTVSLAAYLDNTDGQTLSATTSGTTRTVAISGGNSVNLDVADNDNSATNEIQTISLSSNNLVLSNSGGTVSLTPYLDNTDAQTVSVTNAGTTRVLSISGGNSASFSVADADNSTSNEIQSLSLTGSNLSISGGNTVDLSSLSTAAPAIDEVLVEGNDADGEDLVNLGDLELATGQIIYLGDMNTDGSWRILVSGGEMKFEMRESGVWVAKVAFRP